MDESQDQNFDQSQNENQELIQQENLDIEDQENDKQLNNEKEQEDYEKKEYFQELIQRLKEAQKLIKNAKEEIDEEKNLRIQASKELEEKRLQVKQLLQKQNLTTTAKVESLIKDTLESLVNETLKKQTILRDLQQNEIERCYLNYELERQFYGLRQYVKETKVELKESEDTAQRLKIQIQRQTNTNLILKTDIDEKSQKIQQLKLEAQQLRGTIQNLDDVKKVINRVTDQDQVIIGQNRKFSKPSQHKSVSQQKVNYSTFDVDDNFWYADKSIKLPSVQSQRKRK